MVRLIGEPLIAVGYLQQCGLGLRISDILCKRTHRLGTSIPISSIAELRLHEQLLQLYTPIQKCVATTPQ